MRIGAILSAMLPGEPATARGPAAPCATADLPSSVEARVDEPPVAPSRESARPERSAEPADSLELSPEAQEAAEREAAPPEAEGESSPAEPSESNKSAAAPADSQRLSPEAQRQGRELAARDREVRAHEQAHLSAAGPYARGGAHFEYQTGPDGRRYAVGGEVSIDASAEDEPEATIRKAQVVRAAALAPAEPSAQDRQVAAAATKMEADARAELRQQQSQTPADPARSSEASPLDPAASIFPAAAVLGTRFDAVA